MFFILYYFLTFKKILALNNKSFTCYYIFLYKFFVLTYLMMAQINVETCSTTVKRSLNQHNLRCVLQNACGLFSNKHDRMASIKTVTTIHFPLILSSPRNEIQNIVEIFVSKNFRNSSISF
jgi:hypothetical protein